MEKKKLTWKHGAGIAAGILIAGYCLAAFYFSHRFVYGTKINGVNVSGKTANEVVEIFNKKAENYSLMIKERKNQREVLTNRQIQAAFEGAEEIQKIKENQNSFLWFKGFFGGELYDDVTMYSYNEKTYSAAYKQLNAVNRKKMIQRVNAKPVYKDGKFVIQKEEEGTQLDTQRTAKKIEEYVKTEFLKFLWKRKTVTMTRNIKARIRKSLI